MKLYCKTVLVAAVAACAAAGAAELGTALKSAEVSSNAWNEAEIAMKKFYLPAGFKLEVFAVEPQLANPVAIALDEKGRVFVSETHRYRTSVLDIRNIMDWYEDDLSIRTLDDRIAMIKKHLGPKAADLAKESEVVRLLVDTDGNGRADRSTVFAEGFNSLLDGIASGVLARNGTVYFANIPDVTALQDRNGDGVADTRKTIAHGFGTRFSLTGHDLHGLKFGPDGKLYFSIGDRGSHVVSKEGRTFSYPDEGAVYRCDADGSNLEVFATGLRNPQELAFDEFGNLFSGDNNCDHGDLARLVYIVEGGDTGWRIGFQFSEQNPAGTWNSEKLWHLRWPGQAAYIIPPIGHIAAGPSGLVYAPGTGFSDNYQRRFYLCDFRGQATGSGIHSFKVNTSGAGFTLGETEHFVWDILTPDCDFGPDGRMYIADWVHGWPKSERGRIYRLSETATVNDANALSTQKLLSEGFTKTRGEQLVALLRHPDMRIRQEAQFNLADRGAESLKPLLKVVKSSDHQLARIHAIWAIGQLGQREATLTDKLLEFLGDPDAEIRAQSARVLGDNHRAGAAHQLIAMLKDTSPRVQYFAALALSKITNGDSVSAALDLLRRNNDKDLYLRHAGVMILAASQDSKKLATLAKDPSQSVRMAAVLALRRLANSDIGVFVNDESAAVAVEAARAINDIPIVGALPALANKINDRVDPFSDGTQDTVDYRTPWMRRVINANFRVGGPENAQALARLANDSKQSDSIRNEVLLMLGQWPAPSARDKVTGLWRPLDKRANDHANVALAAVSENLLRTASQPVRAAAASAIANLGITTAGKWLVALAIDPSALDQTRIEALNALAKLGDPALSEVLKSAQNDAKEAVRKAATSLIAKSGQGDAVNTLAKILESGSLSEKQNAFAALANLKGADVDSLLLTWLKKSDLPADLELDLMLAAEPKTDARIKSELMTREQRLPKGDALASYRVSLKGGNAELGRKVFFEKAEVACTRCHKWNGEGGEVGPELAHLAEKQPADYLLESILFPNAKVAPGFESVLLTSGDGTLYGGVVKSENDQVIELNSPEDGLLKIKKTDIKTRVSGLSGMPEGIGNILSKQELRDLLAFLTSKR